MATHLDIVNKVLKRMREDAVVSSTDTDYSSLVAQMVADAYEEVAEETDWQSLKHTVTVTLVPGQTEYNLSAYTTGTGDVDPASSRLAKPDSVLEYVGYDYPNVVVRDTGTGYLAPTEITGAAMRRVQMQDTTNQTDQWPSHFAVEPAETNESMTLTLWPEPTEAYTIQLTFFTSPDMLEDDGTTDDTVLLVPERPVRHLSLVYALNERGEEMGEPGNMAESRYQRSLAGALEADQRSAERANALEWRRD